MCITSNWLSYGQCLLVTYYVSTQKLKMFQCSIALKQGSAVNANSSHEEPPIICEWKMTWYTYVMITISL